MLTRPSNCPVCGVTKPTLFLPSDRFALFKCVGCDFIFTFPQPTNLSVYYQNYRSAVTQKRFIFQLDQAVKLWHQFRAWRLLSYSHPSDQVLDIGCGAGIELLLWAHFGRQAFGTELAPHPAPFPILNSLHQLNRLPKSSFQTVSFFHSLEHLPNPTLYLHAITRLLKPGGYLIIAVPDIASPEARLFGRHWFHLDIPRHLSHFSAHWLIDFLAKQGYSFVGLAHCAPEYDLFSLLQSSLNWLFPSSPNLLYNTLRSPTNARPALLLQLPFFIILIPSILMILPFLWLTGSTGTSHLIMRKNI